MAKIRGALRGPKGKRSAIVIGLTGESGSGKTEVANVLKDMLPDVKVLHGGVCKRVVLGRHRAELIAEYGESVLTQENRVSHEFIVNNPDDYMKIKLRYQEEFAEEMRATIEKESKTCMYLIVERTGLPRLNVWKRFDAKILIRCPEDKRNQFRLVRSDHVGHKLAELGLRDKLAFSEYNKYKYDIVLDNNHDLGQLQELAKKIVKFLIAQRGLESNSGHRYTVKRDKANPSKSISGAKYLK